MQTVLVSGGAGFIGSNFVTNFAARRPEASIVVVDNLTYAGNARNLDALKSNDNFKFIRLDVADREGVLRLFEKYDFTHVVHMAAESHVDRSIADPGIFLKTNVFGTFSLLDAALRVWGKDAGSRKFVHVSTDEVFGSLAEDGTFTESSPYRPNSPYAASKASSDLIARAYFHTYGLPVVTTNCSNNFGPYQFPEKLIPVVIDSCLKRRSIPVYGAGANVRDWLYVIDHCLAIEACLDHGRPGESYVIGARNEIRNLDLVRKICRIVDRLSPHQYPCEDLITFVEDRAGHDYRYAIDPTRIENELGWVPVHSFEESLELTIKWYILNSKWLNSIVSGEYRSYNDQVYPLESGHHD